MSKHSGNIALNKVEAGENVETVYENVCTLTTEPEMCFNYATTEELKDWGFSEGCFSCFFRNKKDIIIQTITLYQNNEGANRAYEADMDFLKNNGYGEPIDAKKIGESSILFEKKQDDGMTYNLLFLKNNVFVGISAKYEHDKDDNIEYLLRFAEKVELKIS